VPLLLTIILGLSRHAFNPVSSRTTRRPEIGVSGAAQMHSLVKAHQDQPNRLTLTSAAFKSLDWPLTAKMWASSSLAVIKANSADRTFTGSILSPRFAISQPCPASRGSRYAAFVILPRIHWT